jgi:hypothetical protein
LQTLYGDQLAIRQEADVVGFEGTELGRDESFETHVHAVTHSGVVTADDQVDLLGTAGNSRRVSLTDDVSRRG